MKQNKYYRVKRVVDNEYYILESCDGDIVTQQIKDIDKLASVFSIEDAKDGDVLISFGFHRNCCFIFNGLDKWKFDEPNGDRAVATGYCCLTLSADNLEFGIQGPDCIEVDTVKPATKKQRDLLFAKIKEAGYEWDEKKKELRKIKPHYDISNFKPFDKVLVRDANNDIWVASMYGNYSTDDNWFICVGNDWRQCIPFEGNEHLLGTTDMCDEQYINW